MNLVRIAFIEAQTLFAKALISILAEDPTLVVAGDLRVPRASDLIELAPDVVVIDLDGQPGDLASTLGTVREAVPSARLCVITIHASGDLMQRCLAHGADAFVLKDIAPAEFTRALHTIASGEGFVDPRVAGGVLRGRSSASDKHAPLELSVRESEVLKLIAEGLANKQISARLHLSEKTVKNHVSRIFAKLNITARTQAAVHAIRAGIV